MRHLPASRRRALLSSILGTALVAAPSRLFPIAARWTGLA
jgi:hypothetical protein